MPEIILKKRLPNLSPEEEAIFCEAINKAYLRAIRTAGAVCIAVMLTGFQLVAVTYSG